MEDVAHPSHGSQIDLEGYRACRNQWCGELILVEIARRTGGLCPTCHRSHLGKQVAAVEAVSRGERMRVNVGKQPASTRNRAKGDYDTKRKTERAKTRALKRLRAVFPDMYDIFYAEERARAGLEPWSLEAAMASSSDPDGEQTLAFAQMYHALSEHGVDVDGPEIQPENQDARPR